MPDNELNIVITATDKASAALKGVRGSIITLNQGLQLAEKAFNAVKKVLEESMQAYVKYADEVRQLSRLNGTTAEETSRLIQVMDDHKVSVSALTMATRKLSQQGLSLTIDSLGKMSDEYKVLSTSAEKTRFLLDKFGRSGLQMAETMEQGGAAIRSQAAAINQNLILTEKSIRAARQYEIAVDNLDDAKSGLAITVGQKVVPAWTDFLNRLNNVISATNKYELETARLINLLNQMPIDSATRSYMAMAEALGLVGLEAAATAEELAAAAEESNALKAQLDGILAFSENYRKYSGDIAALEKERADDLARGYSETGRHIKEIETRIGEAKDAQAEWTNKFIFDMAMMQAAADGLTPDEAQGLMAMAVQLGIIDENAISAYNYLMKINGLDVSGSATITTTYINIGQGGAYTGAVKTPGGSTRRASGGSIPAGGMAWVGDSPSGLTPHSELVYAPHGAQVFNANQSRSMGAGGSPRAFTGGSIPGMSSEMSLSNETIRRLASEIAGAVARVNG